ncbi:MAG TPA: hypothetical protein VGN59_05420 [Acidimicrobiia bacterium]
MAPAVADPAVVAGSAPFGSGAGGAPEGGRVDPDPAASADPAGTVAGTAVGSAATGAPAKITATRPIVAAAAAMPLIARADDAG